MNYPSLSLKQDLIDKVFSGTTSGIQKELKQTPSPGSIRLKKYYKEQKELRLQNVLVEECDRCEYKTTKFSAMYRHKREKHSGIKLKGWLQNVKLRPLVELNWLGQSEAGISEPLFSAYCNTHTCISREY